MVAASHPEALIAARKSRSREGARPIRCLDDVPVTNLTGQLGRASVRRRGLIEVLNHRRTAEYYFRSHLLTRASLPEAYPKSGAVAERCDWRQRHDCDSQADTIE